MGKTPVMVRSVSFFDLPVSTHLKLENKKRIEARKAHGNWEAAGEESPPSGCFVQSSCLPGSERARMTLDAWTHTAVAFACFVFTCGFGGADGEGEGSKWPHASRKYTELR